MLLESENQMEFSTVVCWSFPLWSVEKMEIWNEYDLVKTKKEAPETGCFSNMAPQVGLEPTTLRLTVACSTD